MKDQETHERFIFMRSQGKTFAFIAEQLNVSRGTFDVVSSQKLLPIERCHFFHTYGSMAHQPNWEIDLTGTMPSGQTVTLMLISIALYMGCDPIYLIGMDHDFLASPKKGTHFSDNYEANLKLDLYPSWSYIKIMEACELMWKGYYNLRRVATMRQQRVINATAGGFLDVFPRVDYKDLFE